jgi:hypothetical protein
MEETPFDSTRRLCPDGACVGVIGPDGLCSVCRRTESAAARGDDVVEADEERAVEAAAGETAPGEAASGEAASGEAASDETSDSASAFRPNPLAGASGFDAKRRLCDDGSCVGLVGADGLCAVCGRKAE